MLRVHKKAMVFDNGFSKGDEMKFLEKILILFLTFSLGNLYLPRLSFSQVGFIEPEITKHSPEMRSSPEENIPVEEVTKKRTGWVWWVLGALVVGGAIAVAAAGGGGGGGGSSSTSSAAGNSGSVTVGW
jgi:hypothetical protein